MVRSVILLCLLVTVAAAPVGGMTVTAQPHHQAASAVTNDAPNATVVEVAHARSDLWKKFSTIDSVISARASGSIATDGYAVPGEILVITVLSPDINHHMEDRSGGTQTQQFFNVLNETGGQLTLRNLDGTPSYPPKEFVLSPTNTRVFRNGETLSILVNTGTVGLNWTSEFNRRRPELRVGDTFGIRYHTRPISSNTEFVDSPHISFVGPEVTLLEANTETPEIDAAGDVLVFNTTTAPGSQVQVQLFDAATNSLLFETTGQTNTSGTVKIAIPHGAVGDASAVTAVIEFPGLSIMKTRLNMTVAPATVAPPSATPTMSLTATPTSSTSPTSSTTTSVGQSGFTLSAMIIVMVGLMVARERFLN